MAEKLKFDPTTPLQRYAAFVYCGARSIGYTMRMMGEYGGVDKFQAFLHDRAAAQLMDEEGIEDYVLARERVREAISVCWDIWNVDQ